MGANLIINLWLSPRFGINNKRKSTVEIVEDEINKYYTINYSYLKFCKLHIGIFYLKFKYT
jgi:hypothetical protein